MITLAVVLTEAFATNQNFNPQELYVGTVIIDVITLIVIANVIV